MLRVDVLARSVYEHHIFIENPNSTINWNFSTKKNSIRFGLFFKPCTDAQSSISNRRRKSTPRISRTNSTTTSQTGSSSKWTYSNGTSYTSESDMTTIITTTNSKKSSVYQKQAGDSDMANTTFVELRPIARFQCSKKAVRDSITVQSPGYYVLLFDNTFSMNKKKALYLTVTSDDPSFKNAENVPEFSGWLQRKNQRFNVWNKQWFEYFSSGVLRIYSEPNSPIIGAVQIRFCSLSTFLSRKIIVVDSGTTHLCLRAISDDDFVSWVSCFQNRCAFGMGESGIQSAKSIFEDIVDATTAETATTRSDRVLKSLGDLDTELETLRSLIHQSMIKEANFTNGNQSLESAYHFSTSTKRNLSFRKASNPEPNIPILNLKQDLEGMLLSVNRIDQCKSDIYSGYTAQRPQWINNEILHKTDTIPLSREEKLRAHTLTEEFYDAEEVSSSSNSATPQSSNNENIEEYEEKPALITSGTNQSPISPTSFNQNMIARRNILPHPAVEITISILGLLRKNIGKDLMSVSLPVSINEPLGALQRQCEELEYSYLLDKASEQTSSMERLLYVTLFAVSGYASSQYRIGRKPFNPALAETFECIRPDRGFRFLAEKVSHHPNVMACIAESNNFEFRQTVTGKTKFWGKSLEWIPEGSNHITLVKHKEHYTYTKPSSWVRNIIAGTRYLDHVGDMTVTNHVTGDYAIVSFMESTGGGFFGEAKDKNNVIAKFYDRSNRIMFKVTGKWSDVLFRSQNTKSATTAVWKVDPPHLPNYKDYFGFTQYCMELNEITEMEKGKLPKTDTRLRPDQRLFECGHMKEAEAEKNRIEKDQRVNRKIYDTDINRWSPIWFEERIDGSDPTGVSWFYKGGYWEAREKGEWPSLPFDLW